MIPATAAERTASFARTKSRAAARRKKNTLDLSALAATVPEPEDRIKEGRILKLCVGLGWQERRIILTSSALYLSHLNSDLVLDTVDLYEISRVAASDRKTSLTTVATTSRTGRRGSISTPNNADDATDSNKPPDLLSNDGKLESQNGKAARSFLSGQSSGFINVSSEPSSNGKWEFHTTPADHKPSKSYHFETESDEECREWITLLRQESKRAYKRWKNMSVIQATRAKAAKIYDSVRFKLFITCVIILNFVASAVEAQVRPESGSDWYVFFEILDICFTVLFTLELIFNAFGKWMMRFVRDPWNWFDFLIVALSIGGIWLDAGDFIRSIRILRIVRVVRILRLIRQLEALRNLVESIVNAIGPVLNAFIIVIIVQSIYAVGAVQFFAEKDSVLFGNYAKAMFTVKVLNFMHLVPGSASTKRSD